MSTRTEPARGADESMDAMERADGMPEEAPALDVPASGGRRVAIAMLALAALIAAFTGFRLPNAWSATLQSISVFDGVWRRFLVGTALRPFAVLADQNYFVFAAFSYLVLAAVIAVVCTATIRARRTPQHLLVIAWFLLPTGGFLFNEVGYFDQVLYLLLFASIYLIHRDRPLAATAVLSLAPFVHEMAIVTVIPVFGLVMLRHAPLRRAVVLTLIPTALNAVIFALPVASDAQIAQLTARLSTAGFPFRADVIALFKTHGGDYRGIRNVVREVRPLAIALAGAFAGLWLCERGTWLRRRDLQHPALVVVASCVAIATPYLVAYGGWDRHR